MRWWWWIGSAPTCGWCNAARAVRLRRFRACPPISNIGLLAVPGVASARSFVSHNIQREHNGRPLRIKVQGLAWPEDHGEWVPLTAGRPLGQAHYEMIADRSLGLALGEQLKLGKDTYTVVGIAQGMVSSGGDGIAFFTVRDAQAVQFDLPGEAIRMERVRPACAAAPRRMSVACNRCCWSGAAVRPRAFPPSARPW